MANLVVAGGDFDFNGAVCVGGPARIGIVGEPVLRAELAVDAVKDCSEVLSRIRKKHGAPSGVGHGYECMLTGGVPTIFVLHWPDDDGVKQHIGSDSFPARAAG